VEANARAWDAGVGSQPVAGINDVASSLAVGTAYYNSYPLQCFDRHIRPLNDLYVGLVATRRRVTGSSADPLRKLLTNPSSFPSTAFTLVTFHFAYFSSAMGFDRNFDYQDKKRFRLADGTGRGSRIHFEDAKEGEDYDPFLSMSTRDWEGLVGAWRVGKVVDTAAQKKDQYYGGPKDTEERVTVNVDVEFLDWRALRRTFDDAEIGMRIEGAVPWAARAKGEDVPGGSTSTTEMERANAPLAAFDDGVVMYWPTTYDTSSTSDAKAANRPFDPSTNYDVLQAGLEDDRPAAKTQANTRMPDGSYGLHDYFIKDDPTKKESGAQYKYRNRYKMWKLWKNSLGSAKEPRLDSNKSALFKTFGNTRDAVDDDDGVGSVHVAPDAATSTASIVFDATPARPPASAPASVPKPSSSKAPVATRTDVSASTSAERAPPSRTSAPESPKAPTATPTGTLASSAAGSTAAAAPKPRGAGAVRRARDGASADSVFKSIFGVTATDTPTTAGTSAPTAATTAPVASSSQPAAPEASSLRSPSEGSDSARGRVRRSRDGR
jgi:hypothetical protein